MKTLQVSMENRVGCTLRGIVTLPETNEPVPFVLNLHGFAGSASGYKYLHTHMARMLADHGVGCAATRLIYTPGCAHSLMWIHGVYSFPGRAWEVMWRPASRRVCGRTG